VPEYDAFGREIDEDPLAKLREATVEPARAPAAEAAPAREPEAEPEFVAPVRVPPQFVRPPRKRHRGLAALLVLGAVVAGIGLAASAVVQTVEEGINGVIDVPDTPLPTGVGGDSLIRRANFAEALATLRDSGIGLPITMRVAPDRIDAALFGKDGRTHNVQVDAAGELRELSSSPATDRPATAYKLIDPAAPERLVRAGGKRAGVRPRTIDYLVLTIARPVTWGAYFKGGKIVIGDARGRPQRVL
jgi:hypothetical protein